MDLSKESYIKVLKQERQTLLNEFYKPNEEGTGHFNTAATVLEWRIKSLEQEILEELSA
jgi:hypothetical protein